MIDALSERELDLLRQVYARRSWIQGLLGEDRRLHALHELERSRKVAVILQLFPLVNSNEKKFAQAVVRAMHGLFGGLRTADFPAFDENIRRQSWNPWSADGYTVVKAPREIGTLTRFGSDFYFLAGVFSCHADGYTREAAVRILGRCHTGEELPFLLLRVNDWVENVRNVAKELLQARICEQYIRHFVSFLPLVLRLTRAGRQNHEEIVGRIQSLLATPEALSSIEEGMRSSDGITRRFCYGIALRAEDSQKLQLVARSALEEANFRISLDALRAIARAKSSPDLRGIVGVAFRSPVGVVRLAALRVTLEKYPESANAECQVGLLDRNPGVRQQAQYHLQKSGSLNVCAYYAEVLPKASYQALPNVIAGIGEICSKTQSVLLEPYLSSSRSAVRMHACRSLAQLDREHPVEDFLKALEDASAKVVRTAALVLRKRVNLVGGDKIWEIHMRLKNARHRSWTLFLIAGLMKWDACYFLIRGLNDIDAEVSRLARRYLERWMARYNESFVVLNEAQRERLNTAVDENKHLLMSAELLLLTSVLRTA